MGKSVVCPRYGFLTQFLTGNLFQRGFIKPRPIDCNISTQHIYITTLLNHVAIRSDGLANNTQDVATYCSSVARQRVQHVVPSIVAICCVDHLSRLKAVKDLARIHRGNITCGMIKGVMKHVSWQHKYTNHNISYSKVHQKIVHWLPHLFSAINNQANQHIAGDVNQNQE